MQTFESYDYLKISVDENFVSQYLDGYSCFGWKPDENVPAEKGGSKVQLHFKRSRSIPGKTELIRLQQHYEACMAEIATLEASKSSVPTMVSLTCGLVGCAFMAGAVFAVTAEPPIIWLTVLLAIPGFALWGGSYFGYKIAKQRRTAQVAPLIEAKFDEAYQVCEKAQQILNG